MELKVVRTKAKAEVTLIKRIIGEPILLVVEVVIIRSPISRTRLRVILL